MILPSGPVKSSSGRARDQMGSIPPPAEIRHGPPLPAKGRTYTSKRPVSLDWYASQRPSGENIASRSSKGLLRKTLGLPGLRVDPSVPSNGRIQISKFVRVERSLYAGSL